MCVVCEGLFLPLREAVVLEEDAVVQLAVVQSHHDRVDDPRRRIDLVDRRLETIVRNLGRLLQRILIVDPESKSISSVSRNCNPRRDKACCTHQPVSTEFM